MTITVPEAVETIKQGKMIIIVDDEQRENEGDLMIAAEKVTPESINFMAREGRGLICASMTEKRSEELDLPLMVPQSQDPRRTAYTVTVNTGTGTGTIRLDVPASATVTDLAGNPLAGPSYTSGETYDVRFYRAYIPLVVKY